MPRRCSFRRFRLIVQRIVRRNSENQYIRMISIGSGGRGGIRTHGTLAGTPVFKTGALNHSATLPLLRHQPLSSREIKNSREQKWFWPQLGPKVLQDPRKLAANAWMA